MNEPAIPKVTGQALLDFLEQPSYRSPSTVHNCRTYVRKILAAAYGEAWSDHPFAQDDVTWQIDHFAGAATIGPDSIRSYQAGYSSLVADYFAWVTTREPPKTSMKRVIAEMHAFERARRAKLAAFPTTLANDDMLAEPLPQPEVLALLMALLAALPDEVLDRLGDALT